MFLRVHARSAVSINGPDAKRGTSYGQLHQTISASKITMQLIALISQELDPACYDIRFQAPFRPTIGIEVEDQEVLLDGEIATRPRQIRTQKEETDVRLIIVQGS